MAIRPIRLYGDPALREKAAEVTSFDETVRQLAEDLRETMAAYRGVGLAATQVGVSQRILVVGVPVDDAEPIELCLVNPTILSPGVYEEVSRSLKIRVRAADENGRESEIDAEGYLARAIQHEIDHLDGVLFIDRLSPLKRQFLRRTLEGIARGEVPDGYRPPHLPGGAA
jgi:peptide deformylase